MYKFCEQVSKYHPDKVADQISDAIFQEYYIHDKNSKCNIETMVSGKTIIVSGNATSSYSMTVYTVNDIIHTVMKSLNYEVDRILNYITPQSTQINKAVVQNNKVMAGDQGIVVGYYNKSTIHGLPPEMEYCNNIIYNIEQQIEQDTQCPLKGDAKVLVVYDDYNGIKYNNPKYNKVKHITISVCHKEQYSLNYIKEYIDKYIYTKIDNATISINPGGVWTIGGPVADNGLTGRKIVCDNYGPRIPVGGGCFSGKDFSKIDRSGAYMARYLAKEVCTDYDIRECIITAGYEIGNNNVLYYNIIGDDKDITDMFVGFNDLMEVNNAIKYCNDFVRDVNLVKLSAGCHFRGILDI